MIPDFTDLTPSETALMLDALPAITVLVGAADGNLDATEMRAAQSLAEVRAYNDEERLRNYYELIADNFTNRVKELRSGLPSDTESRQQALCERLGGLNEILKKFPSPRDYYYYATFRSFAKHIARSHGGFLRFLTIGPEEAKVVDLPMLTPIAEPPEEEE